MSNEVERGAKLNVWLVSPQYDNEQSSEEGDNDEESQLEEEEEEEEDWTHADLARQIILFKVTRVMAFILFYLAFLLPIVYFSYILPPTTIFEASDTLSKWSSNWPWGTFVIWELTIVTGYTFVAYVTERRDNPIKDREGRYLNFVKIILSSPIIYVLGPIRSLHYVSNGYTYTISEYLQSFLFNAVCIVSFFVGMQFTYLDYIMLFRRAGDKFGSPSLWKTYTRNELILIVILVIFILGVVSYQIYVISTYKLLLWYLIFYGIVFFIMIAPVIIFRKRYYLHVHHYQIFGVLIPFFAFPNIFSLIWLGLVSGVYVEGVARWGMASCWQRGTSRDYT